MTAQSTPRAESASRLRDEFTVRWSRPEGERTGHLLVVLHGYGADENDLFSLCREFPERITVASLRAPLGLPTGGYAWFPLTESLDTDPALLRRVIEATHAWVDEASEEFESVSLLGFSQGMAVATSLLRRDPAGFACTVALSGFVVDPQAQVPELAGAFRPDGEVAAAKPKVFWGRDQDDPVIPEELVAQSHAWLNENVDLMKIVYTGIGHGIGPQEIGHIVEYLDQFVPGRG